MKKTHFLTIQKVWKIARLMCLIIFFSHHNLPFKDCCCCNSFINPHKQIKGQGINLKINILVFKRSLMGRLTLAYLAKYDILCTW